MFIRKFFGAILLLAIIAMPLTVNAEKTDWSDRNFNFRAIRTVIVLDATVSPDVGYVDSVALRNLQQTFLDNSRKLKCRVITEAEARQELSYRLGTDLNRMSYERARHVIIDNADLIADAWVTGNVDTWANNTYMTPERTVWESRRETYTYRDRHGNRREEVRYVQVPVHYPPRRVDVSTIQMTLQICNAQTGQALFVRRDVRDREDYQAQRGMFGRITNSFFEDVGKKIH